MEMLRGFYPPCRFMRKFTFEGAAVGLSRDIVRNFCKANGMDGYARAMALNMQERLACGKACACCGKEISQPGNGRPRKFCSDRCRRAW